MDKDELWKALHEPARKWCGNCRSYSALADKGCIKYDTGLLIDPCYYGSHQENRVDKWEWNGKK